MPVGFEIIGGMLRVRQSFDFPAVYLDHWAIRRFSSKLDESGRFIAALKASGGALVISHTNLAEITGPKDPRHAVEVAAFLEAVLPNIYFAMFDVQKAIDQEKVAGRDVGVRLKVPPDLELLAAVARERPDDFQLFTIRGVVLAIAQNRERLGATWRETNQDLADRIDKLRRDPEFVDSARKFRGHRAAVPTLAIMQELLRPLYLDSMLTVDRNDAGDIHHAILSIAYCDYALLDGRWEDLHDRMKRRFAKLGHKIPTAAVYSSRRSGVERFLQALAARRGPGTVKTAVFDTRS